MEASSIARIASKSCLKCRDRKVRCDRSYPSCRRCRRRQELCTFPDYVYVEDVDDPGSSRQRVAQLELKFAYLETQLAKGASVQAEASSASTSGQDLTPTPNPTPSDLSASRPIKVFEDSEIHLDFGYLDSAPPSVTQPWPALQEEVKQPDAVTFPFTLPASSVFQHDADDFDPRTSRSLPPSSIIGSWEANPFTSGNTIIAHQDSGYFEETDNSMDWHGQWAPPLDPGADAAEALTQHSLTDPWEGSFGFEELDRY